MEVKEVNKKTCIKSLTNLLLIERDDKFPSERRRIVNIHSTIDSFWYSQVGQVRSTFPGRVNLRYKINKPTRKFIILKI